MNEFKENSKKLGDIIDRVLAQRDFIFISKFD